MASMIFLNTDNGLIMARVVGLVMIVNNKRCLLTRMKVILGQGGGRCRKSLGWGRMTGLIVIKLSIAVIIKRGISRDKKRGGMMVTSFRRRFSGRINKNQAKIINFNSTNHNRTLIGKETFLRS